MFTTYVQVDFLAFSESPSCDHIGMSSEKTKLVRITHGWII